MGWRLVKYLETHQYWTLRLRISLYQSFFIASWMATFWLSIAVCLYHTAQWLPAKLSGNLTYDKNNYLSAPIYFLCTLAFILGIESTYTSCRRQEYLRLRWMAWSGDSRTGIPAPLTRYIGDLEDWENMSKSGAKIEMHPVDQFSFEIFSPRARLGYDPTDLLRVRWTLDQVAGSSQIMPPPAHNKAGLYHPISHGQSVSLKWGEDLGFRRRCSRGIISVPPNLLTSWPTLRSGLSGEALCLACGILSRNKGLQPTALVCNLESKSSFRQWEECQFPHPAKTLRTFYRREVDKVFGGLGSSYVTAGTELALLLAGLKYRYIELWLRQGLEHQDLELNHLVASLGANNDELETLYRGQYASMLISLAFAEHRPSIRPEISVFSALCSQENLPTPKWWLSSAIQMRRKAEEEAYGPVLQTMINAII